MHRVQAEREISILHGVENVFSLATVSMLQGDPPWQTRLLCIRQKLLANYFK